MTKNNRNKILTFVFIGLLINIFLTVLKIGFGLWGNAQSLVSDGVNSFSDVFMSLMIFFVLKVSTKEADKNHPYGHQKFEGLAYFTIGIVFSITAIFIGFQSIQSIINYLKNATLFEKPNIVTLYISILSVFIKIALTTFYFKANQKFKNPTLKAEYKNHFYDLWSSVLTVVALFFAQFNFLIFDYMGSLVIGVFILRLSIQVIIEASSFLVDQSASEDIISEIRKHIKMIEGVISIDDLKVRKHMTEFYVDVEIGVNNDLSLEEAHEISEIVHLSVEQKFEEVIHCMVHVNPHPMV